MSDLVLEASLALQWFLDDELNRKYSLAVLASLSDKRAVVPLLWFYEVGNGLLMAHRRQRISLDRAIPKSPESSTYRHGATDTR